MHVRWLRVLGVGAAALAAACTSDMNVTVTRTPAADEVLAGGPHCAPQRLTASEADGLGCFLIGEAFVGDTGHSWRCSQERVERDLTSVACSLGADAMLVAPVEGSGCHQARASFFACDPEEGSGAQSARAQR